MRILKKTTKKRNGNRAVAGAAFLMATSAIGPGFLTQTSKFTNDFGASFGFVILCAAALAVIAQMNIWRVLCVTGLRGQEVANKLLPGLGFLVSGVMVLGGLVFNIGNVGGGALGLNSLLGIPTNVGYLVTGVIATTVFLLKNAKAAMDTITRLFGGMMIVVIFIAILLVKPPVGTALISTVAPSVSGSNVFPAVVTLLGGTVGGYITFAGAHRLIDAGVTGEENLKKISAGSVKGIGIVATVRVLLFLAVLGVLANGVSLDAENPAADAFRRGLGVLGYRFFGLVLWCASITSIIGAAYTSVSFFKTFHPTLEKRENQLIVAFIVLSTVVMLVLGSPASLLVLAGALNGLLLPVTLTICLIASKKKSIVGEEYTHPAWLFALGVVVVAVSAWMGVNTFATNIGRLLA